MSDQEPNPPEEAQNTPQSEGTDPEGDEVIPLDSSAETEGSDMTPDEEEKQDNPEPEAPEGEPIHPEEGESAGQDDSEEGLSRQELFPDSPEETPPEDSPEDGETTSGMGFGDIVTDKAGQERDKWFIFAIGGCGNNLIDAIYMRKKLLEDEEDPREILWDAGIDGEVVTNTATKEIQTSYYAKEVQNNRADIYANDVDFPGEGGGQVESEGDKMAKRGLENNLIRDWEVSPGRADAVMFLHSAVQATGSGATPRVAQRLNNDLRDRESDYVSLPVYSSVVLPDRVRNGQGDYQYKEDEGKVLQGGQLVKNATICLSRLAEELEVVIPFQNLKLNPTGTAGGSVRNFPQADLGDYKPVNFQQYYNHNQALVSYLETFAMTSVQDDEDEAGFEVQGAGSFDVFDPWVPSRDKNPNNYDSSDLPATIFAPAHTRSRREEFTEQHLIESLIADLLTYKLVDFDHRESWGCSVIFYGSESAIQTLSNRDGWVKQALTNKCAVAEDGFLHFEVMDYYYTIPDMDGVGVWAGFWNPELQIMEDCKTYMDNRVDNDERLTEFENDFNRLYDNLGRKAFE